MLQATFWVCFLLYLLCRPHRGDNIELGKPPNPLFAVENFWFFCRSVLVTVKGRVVFSLWSKISTLKPLTVTTFSVQRLRRNGEADKNISLPCYASLIVLKKPTTLHNGY